MPSPPSPPDDWPRPWVGLAYGEPDGPAETCWTFLRAVLAGVFGIDVPAVACPETAVGRGRVFRDHPERQRWRQLDLERERPQDGDAVLLTQGRRPMHCGLFYGGFAGGALLHADAPASRLELLGQLRRLGWQVEGFYRCRD